VSFAEHPSGRVKVISAGPFEQHDYDLQVPARMRPPVTGMRFSVGLTFCSTVVSRLLVAVNKSVYGHRDAAECRTEVSE